MLDNDDLTYSYQRRSVNNSPERALITLERSQNWICWCICWRTCSSL